MFASQLKAMPRAILNVAIRGNITPCMMSSLLWYITLLIIGVLSLYIRPTRPPFHEKKLFGETHPHINFKVFHSTLVFS